MTSAAGGGKCGAGALSAAFSKIAVVNGWSGGDKLSGTITSAVVGGTGSVLGGGKFANGAVTGAFGYLFNYLAHLQVERLYTTESGTYSRFTLFADGKQVYSGYGVEPVGNAGLGFDWVAPGTYDLAPENSSRFGPDTLTVQDPLAEGSGRQMSVVRIHSGNRPADTEGCYVPGTGLSFDQVTGSRDALSRIRTEMSAPGVTERSITYTNPINSRWYVPGGRR